MPTSNLQPLISNLQLLTSNLKVMIMLEAHHWNTLELPKVLAKLANYTSFSAGTELARALEPSTFAEVVAQRLAETR